MSGLIEGICFILIHFHNDLYGGKSCQCIHMFMVTHIGMCDRQLHFTVIRTMCTTVPFE